MSDDRRAAAPAKRDEIVYDPTNERVVCSVAVNADAKRRGVLVRTISDEEFLVPENAAIWRALRALVDRNLEYDPEVFRRLLADEGTPVPEDYLTAIEAMPAPANVQWHVETLRWDATRARCVRGSLRELVQSMRDPKASPDVVSAHARAVLRVVEGGGGRRYMRRGDELAHTYKTDVRKRRAAGNHFPFGHVELDEHMTEGAMPKRTGLVVGLSGSGKSTLAADLARTLAQGGRRPLYGAWEMTSESSLDVMAAQMSRVPIAKIVRGELDDTEARRVERCVDWLTENIVFMDNAFFGEDVRGRGTGRRSNDRSLDVIEGYIAESGCDVVIMDLWERALADLSYDGVTTALYRQQEMHARYNVYGLMVHQLRLKDIEGRADKRPTREGIKGTGAFVEVADQIFGVHRDAQFRAVTDDTIEVICLKQRKGESNWCVRYDWGKECGLITNGRTVPYDPGLEMEEQFGTIDTIPTKRGRGGRGRRGP